MVRIDFLILGYRKIKIPAENLSEISSILLRASVPSRIDSQGNIVVREKDFVKIQTLLCGRINFEHSEPLGLYGAWLKLEHKWTYVLAGAICAFVIMVLSSLIWDVRIEGNEKITDIEIVNILSECGMSVGDFWGGINRSEVESRLLRSNDEISWISINRRGVVAYIKVIEKEKENIIEMPRVEYSNIVASADCIIEEVTVSQGTALVKPGDVVKKGDVLIVGCLSEESGGYFCSAEGSVLGRVSDSVSLKIDRRYEKKCGTKKKLYCLNINFFKFSINIFKLYGNLPTNCDIIDDEITYSLFGRCKLPFSISKKTMVSYDFISTEYTDDEIIKVAYERLSALMATRLATSDLVRLRTYGNFTDEGYVLRSEYTYICDVGDNLAFTVE